MTDYQTVINDMTAPAARRLAAIDALGTLRRKSSADALREQSGDALGAMHLGVDELPGQDILELAMTTPDDLLEVRCKAAAVLAQTGSVAALARCNDLLDMLLRA